MSYFMSPPPFSLRDFFQRIFPTIIAACLFVPFLEPLNKVASLEGLIFGAIVFSYLIESPVSRIVSLVYDKLPKPQALSKRMRWIANNWDYDALFYSITTEEREYLYLTHGYARFYKTISFYLLAYALLNMFILLRNATPIDHLPELWSRLSIATTPTLAMQQVPTLPLLSVSILLCYFTFRDYLLEYKVLFLDGGAYPKLAERYHREKGKIAKSIWGVVYQSEKVVPNADLSLYSNDGEITTVRTDQEGRFQFIGKFSQCVNTECRLKIKACDHEREIQVPQDDKHVPYFRIDMDAMNAER